MNLGLLGAFDFAREQNAWFKSVTFEAFTGQAVRAEITLARNGSIRTDGALSRVFESLVLPICGKVYESYMLFRKRSQRDSPRLEVRPLTIDFGREIIAGEEETRLVEAIKLQPKTSVSIVHRNPYIQASVVDYVDGSIFDLWVLNPRELIVVPQLKGTISAIRRLIANIFNNYAEGTVKDFAVAETYG